ncbi:ABC transporter permease [Pseudomonas syringae pv. spinaceae]|uniref:ABC transporter permease n=1 Tax=Pseudomonas syringae pv. spinaceae TaxID=264459 RepID=A0A0Q0JKW1_PSESX|nr:ABC transporter permease [Pseudomonas syringae pv. spinaceae]
MTIALAHVQQAVELALAARNGGRVQPAFVCRAVTGLEACADILAGLDDVIRVQCVITDHAANGAAAVQGRGRAAEDFDALDDFRVDIVAAGLRIRPDEEAVRDFHAVDLSHDAVAVYAANVIAGRACALASTADRNTRLVAHQVTDGIDVVAIQLFTRMHADSTRHCHHFLSLTRGADGDLIESHHACGAFFEHHVVVAQVAIAQRAAGQQGVQRLGRAQVAAGTRGGDVLREIR